MKAALFIAFLLSGIRASTQKFASLAATPPMGWNSWNTFQCKIDESLIKETANSLISSGMREAGYNYIIIDDGWMEMDRDSAGNLVPDKIRFPHGIKALADYVHARGLKLGIYNCAGAKTCGGYPGARGHEYQDARLYAFWTIDYLKIDWCNTDGINAKEAYSTMSDAIRTAGRPMVFSICEWGVNNPWLWAKDVGHLWRTTMDIYRCFDCRYDHASWYWAGPMKILDMQETLRKYAGPGHWNDPDMLEVGNGLTASENRAHFTMWSMLAAPLIAGNDLRSMSAETAKILTQKAVLEIDQDSLGIPAFPYQRKDSLEIWFRPLNHGDWAVSFLNRASTRRMATFDWTTSPVVDTLNDRYLKVFEKKYRLVNAWTTRDAGTTGEPFNSWVAPHDVILFRLIEMP